MPRIYKAKGNQRCSACGRVGHNAKSLHCPRSPKGPAMMLARAIIRELEVEASSHDGAVAEAIGAVRKAIERAAEKVAS